ncbi:hypothetical protein C7830_09115 [Pandoraea apista]|nr:hypothetical protein C7830_09115 [Pandoraea apista]
MAQTIRRLAAHQASIRPVIDEQRLMSRTGPKFLLQWLGLASDRPAAPLAVLCQCGVDVIDKILRMTFYFRETYKVTWTARSRSARVFWLAITALTNSADTMQVSSLATVRRPYSPPSAQGNEMGERKKKKP